MNELGNTPADKDYQPSGISRAEQAYNKMFHNPERMSVRSVVYPTEGTLDYREPFRPFFLDVYQQGYEQAEKDLALKFKELREVQMKWRKTRVYGWRCKMMALEKEVDEIIKNILGDESRH